MTRKERNEILCLVGNLLSVSGCGCCSDYRMRDKAEKELGEFLRARKYRDGSGYDFGRYASEVTDGK